MSAAQKYVIRLLKCAERFSGDRESGYAAYLLIAAATCIVRDRDTLVAIADDIYEGERR